MNRWIPQTKSLLSAMPIKRRIKTLASMYGALRSARQDQPFAQDISRMSYAGSPAQVSSLEPKQLIDLPNEIQAPANDDQPLLVRPRPLNAPRQRSLDSPFLLSTTTTTVPTLRPLLIVPDLPFGPDQLSRRLPEHVERDGLDPRHACDRGSEEDRGDPVSFGEEGREGLEGGFGRGMGMGDEVGRRTSGRRRGRDGRRRGMRVDCRCRCCCCCEGELLFNGGSDLVEGVLEGRLVGRVVVVENVDESGRGRRGLGGESRERVSRRSSRLS
jgi:hypothetical protein